MPNLTSVTVTSGIPTAGDGTVSTIDALMADGGQATLGSKTDNKSTATDTTSVSAISLWKQISASAQAIASALAGTLTVAAHVVTVPSIAGFASSATFTPANSSHAANDCVGAAQQFTGLGAAGEYMITSAALYIDSTSAYATAWRLHLYNVTPSSAIADDSAWDFADADVAQYLGYIDLPSTATDTGTNQWVQVDGINHQITTTTTSIYGYLQLLTTTTLAAVGHKVFLHFGAA